MLLRTCFVCILAALLLGACGGSSSSLKSVTAESGTSTPEPLGETRDISENELTRYLAVLTELRAMDEARPSQAPTEVETILEGADARGAFDTVLRRHGFTRDSFHQVHDNVVRAYSAVRIDEQSDDMDKARAKQQAAIQAMKGKVSAQQLETTKRAMDEADAMLESYRNAPPANKALVQRYRERLGTALGAVGD